MPSKINLAQLKKVLRAKLPRVKSTHVDEAMARAVGHRTYASLLAEMKQCQDQPKSAMFSTEKFAVRLNELGYDVPISAVTGERSDRIAGNG